MSLSVDRAIRKAKRHAKKGEIELAEKKYKSVLEKYPNNKPAIEGLKRLQSKTSMEVATDTEFLQQQVNGLIALYNQGKLQQSLKEGEALAKQFPNVPSIVNLLGVVNFGLRRLDEAVANYAKALRLKPDYAQAHNNLGNALKDLGRSEEAVASYRRALQIKPDYAQAHTNLGVALNDLGRSEEAVASHRRAVQINSNYPEVHNNLGVALCDLGKPEEAVVSYHRALQITQDNAEVHNNLGAALNKLRRFSEAVASYRRALRIKPDYIQAHNNLSVALNELGRSEEAVASCQRALQIKPDYAQAHVNLGNALRDLGRFEEVMLSYQKAVEIKPDYAEAHNNLGNVLKHLGRSEEAKLSYHQALKVKPNYAEAYRNIGSLKKYQDDDPQMHRMLELVARNDISDEDRMHLSFALGKAYGDMGDHHKAFSYLFDANRLRKEELKYEISSAQEEFSKIRSLFSEKFPALGDHEEFDGKMSQHPIFVLGMPRSGTTLVEQILASHSQVYGAGELGLLSQSVEAAEWNSTPLASDKIDSIRKSYFSGLGKIGASEQFVTDKMPSNFRLIGFIMVAMPEAKVIHVKRDACATCWSNYKLYFPSKDLGFVYGLQDLAKYYKMYMDLMAFWHDKFPGRIYDLNYEALTEHQEEETHKLLEHIGLDWEDQCVEFYETERVVRTASATQVRQKMYKGSSEEWRKYEEHLKPMIDLLNDL